MIVHYVKKFRSGTEVHDRVLMEVPPMIDRKWLEAAEAELKDRLGVYIVKILAFSKLEGEQPERKRQRGYTKEILDRMYPTSGV